MKETLKKMGKAVDDVVGVAEEAVFTEDGEREIDLSLPGIENKTTLKKHKRGIYSMKRKQVNYPLLIIVGVILLIGIFFAVFR